MPIVSLIDCTTAFGLFDGGNSRAFSIACSSKSFALSAIGCDACPDVPIARTFNHSTCLSPTDTPNTVLPSAYKSFEPMPPSSNTNSGFNSSQCFSIIQAAPNAPSDSSSHVARNTMSRGGTIPICFSRISAVS